MRRKRTCSGDSCRRSDAQCVRPSVVRRNKEHDSESRSGSDVRRRGGVLSERRGTSFREGGLAVFVRFRVQGHECFWGTQRSLPAGRRSKRKAFKSVLSLCRCLLSGCWRIRRRQSFHVFIGYGTCRLQRRKRKCAALLMMPLVFFPFSVRRNSLVARRSSREDGGC